MNNFRKKNSRIGKFLSFFIPYMTGFFFGFHLTSFEIIRKNIFDNSDKKSIFYFVTALIFILPIISNILRAKIQLKLKTWIALIHFLQFISFGCNLINDYRIFYFSRSLAGIAIGLSVTVAPQYIAEIEPKKRGFYVSLFNVAILVGIVIGQISVLFAQKPIFTSITFMIPSFLAFFCIIFTKILISPKESEKSEEKKENSQKGFSELIRNRESHKSIFISVIVHLSQQMSSINGIIVYSNSILGPGFFSSEVRTVLMGLFSLFMNLICSFILEKFGRKKLLQISHVLVIISLILLSFQKYVFFSVLLFQAGFNIGLGPITWVLTNEIFPQEYISVAPPILSMVNWLFASLNVLFFEYFYTHVGPKILLVNVVSLIFFAGILEFFLTETKSKPIGFL